jgi:mannose-6-phosphate isomerase-like protein (cupin superfamily)
MLIKKLNKCEEFTAGDDTKLREILHPDKEGLKLRYSLAHATLKSGKKSYKHTLKTSEVYFILEGKGLMRIGDESKEVTPGDTVYIPPKQVQFIENTGKSDLKFICIVDPAWSKQDEEILE